MRTRSQIGLALLLVLTVPMAVTASPTAKVHPAKHGKTVVVHKGPRGKVVVHHGFPIARPLPMVYVRAPRVAVRVVPRVYLPRFVFPAVVVRTRPAPARIVWHQAVVLQREEEWLEDTLVVAHSGSHLYFEVADGPARVSFAEVVYDGGETQVVDFDDRVYAPGLYGLVELETARGIDHVRLVAASDGDATAISLHLAL